MHFTNLGQKSMETETGRREESSSADDCPIEITNKMIEAGLPALYAYNAETCIAEETVATIFRAMLLKSPLVHRAR
jgi:hypothetical protein